MLIMMQALVITDSPDKAEEKTSWANMDPDLVTQTSSLEEAINNFIDNSNSHIDGVVRFDYFKIGMQKFGPDYWHH